MTHHRYHDIHDDTIFAVAIAVFTVLIVVIDVAIAFDCQYYDD
jgi:hypothetical protein